MTNKNIKNVGVDGSLIVLTNEVKNAIKNLHVEKFCKDSISFRTSFLWFKPLITLDAVKFKSLFPNGFPTTIDGKLIPNRSVLTVWFLGFKITVVITFQQWVEIIERFIK